MKNNLLTIGQMAKLNHTTLATLRLYDDKGLLKPKSVNPMNGYRRYDVCQSAVFHMIQYNKDLGLNLNEIKALLDCSDQAFLVDMYHQKLKDLDQQMKYILWQKEQIRSILDWKDHVCHLPPRGVCTLEYVRNYDVFVKKATRNYFQEDFGSVVYDLAHLKVELRQKGIHGIYSYHAFVTMKLDDFLARRYRAAELGVIIPDKDEATGKIEVQSHSSNMSASVYLDGFDHVPAYLDQLRDTCQQKHYTMLGDVICQIVAILDPCDYRKTSEILRLQIPVQKNADNPSA